MTLRHNETVLEQPPKDTVKMKSKRIQESKQNTREVSAKSFTENPVDRPLSLSATRKIPLSLFPKVDSETYWEIKSLL